jgi:hypothetical protein
MLWLVSAYKFWFIPSMNDSERKVMVASWFFALCFIVYCVVNEPSFGQTNVQFGFPNTPKAVSSSTKTITGVTLRWDKGYPPETTVSNITARTSIYAGLADVVMFYPLPLGSTNTFVAFNSGGSSQTLEATGSVQTVTSSICVYSYLVTVPVKPNKIMSIMTSTNLLTWYQVSMVLTTNSNWSLIWTNDNAPQRWFRSVSL